MDTALSPDEGYVLRRLCEGLRYGEIATEMGYNYFTISKILYRAQEKLGARTPVQACVLFAKET